MKIDKRAKRVVKQTSRRVCRVPWSAETYVYRTKRHLFDVSEFADVLSAGSTAHFVPTVVRTTSRHARPVVVSFAPFSSICCLAYRLRARRLPGIFLANVSVTIRKQPFPRANRFIFSGPINGVLRDGQKRKTDVIRPRAHVRRYTVHRKRQTIARNNK